MMQEVSLTGATLLEDDSSNMHRHHHHQYHHSHQDRASSCGHDYHPNQDPLAAIPPPPAHPFHHQQQQQTQQVDAGSELTTRVFSNNNDKQCCDHHGHNKPATVVQPQLSLTIPVQELVQQSVDSITKALWQVIRVGTFDLWIQIIEAWQNQVKIEQEHSSTRSDTAANNSSPHHQEVVYAHIRDFMDASGYSFLHWATKRADDIQFCQFLVDQVKCSVQCVSQDSTAMTPLHWACTLPYQQALPMIRILLTAAAANYNTDPNNNAHHPDHDVIKLSLCLEIPDATGCTPLLLAAQHGHVETIAYLLKKGANVLAVDHNRDSAVHWAAYKGSANVLGLLTFYMASQQQFWTAPDIYGQMPLHLAALRGNTTVCRYILHQLHQSVRDVATVLHHVDKNGRTPLDLAVTKQKPTVAAVLQQAEYDLQDRQQARGGGGGTLSSLRLRTTTARWKRKILQGGRNLCSAHEWKVWLGLPEVDDVDESPKFPYYYVWFHLCANIVYSLTVFWPMFNVGEGVLWDKVAWEVMLILFAVASAASLIQTTNTNPGRLDARHPHIAHWRRLYEATLESYAKDDDIIMQDKNTTTNKPALCHTCHIARPPRCKHDRFTRSCIEQFDHHCPFVSASIGLYNYRWFLLFLTCTTCYFTMFWITFVTFMSRHSAHQPWMSDLLGFFLGVHAPFPAGMWIYHVQLVLANLTTNEHANRVKYDYLWEIIGSNNNNNNDADTTPVRRRYRNPFHRGAWGNVLSRIFPSEASYRLPDDDEKTVGLLLLAKDSMV